MGAYKILYSTIEYRVKVTKLITREEAIKISDILSKNFSKNNGDLPEEFRFLDKTANNYLLGEGAVNELNVGGDYFFRLVSGSEAGLQELIKNFESLVN